MVEILPVNEEDGSLDGGLGRHESPP
jgi:hypothetical protein